MKIPRRLTAALVGVITLVVVTGSPAFAVDHPFSLEMISGRMRIQASFVTANIDTPGSSIPTCPAGTTALTGKVTLPGTTDNMEATLAISVPFRDPWSTADYVFTATGTTGAVGGTNTKPGSFDGVTLTDMVIPVGFTISTYNQTTCTVVATACSGTVTLTATGGSLSGTMPPFDVSDSMYVNASGVIDVTSTACPGSIGAVVRDNATLTLMDIPTGSGQGAVFHQV